MAGTANDSGIRDNHRRGLVADFLKEPLDRIEHPDFRFGEPRFIASLDPDKTEKKAFILDAHCLHLASCLQQKRVARECAEWIRQKVEIRSVRHAQLLHGKMATENPGFTFVNWTDNGVVVSTTANYDFVVTSNRTLVANFAMIIPQMSRLTLLKPEN